MAHRVLFVDPSTQLQADQVLSADLSFGASLSATVNQGATLAFSDGFESGDFNSPTGTNADWGTPSSGISVQSTNPQAGTYSARFRFSAKANCVDDSQEVRFFFDQVDRVVWAEWYVFIPTNYIHRSQSGCADVTSHHKFFAIWGGKDLDGNNGYGASGRPKYVLELWRVDDNTSNLRIIHNMGGSVGSQNLPTNATANNLTTGISASGPMTTNTWHRIRMRADTGTDGDDNAQVQVYVDDTTMFDFQNIKNTSGGDPNGTSPGLSIFYWDVGYLLGYTNGAYASQTDWYVDEFKVYSSDPGW